MVNSRFWKDKNVLVTGHTGFKGSWLCLWLRGMGARVTGYALPPPTKPSLFEMAGVASVVHSIEGDVRDLGRLTRTVADSSPDVILHMAAQSLVLESYRSPVDTYSTNVLGTVHLLEAVRLSGKQCSIVNVTTDKCYENEGWVWGYRETDQLGGRDPYSNSKACAELVARSYRQSFFPLREVENHGVAVASARAGNVIGGGDWTPRQLIPDAIAAFAGGEKVRLRHPDAVRPWQHVLDCLGGYLLLAERLSLEPAAFSGEWNFGPSYSDARTVSEVIDLLAREWGGSAGWERESRHHLHEEAELRLDSSKSNRHLGWSPRLGLEEAVRWVVGWYRRWMAGEDAGVICRTDIERYMVHHA